MSKEPNLFWCDQCELYVSKPPTHHGAEPFRRECPNCHQPLEVANVKPPAPEFFCPSCQLEIRARDAIPRDGSRPASCSACGTTLQLATERTANPLSLPFSLTLIGVVARLLVRSGCLERLHEYARNTATPLDNFALQIAQSLIVEAAKL